MTEHSEGSRGTHFLVAAAALVVVVAGLKAASGVVLPFVVAVCLAVLAAPPMFWLRRRGLPSGLAVFLVVTALAAVVAFAGVFVAASFNQLLAELPRYEIQLQQELDRLGAWLRARGVPTSPDFFGSLLDPEGVPGVIAALLASVGEILTDAVLVLLLVIFILLEASSFPVKVKRAFRRPEVTLEGFAEFAAKLNRYIAVKTLVSVATAVAVGGWTWLLGVEFPFLWAVLAFLLNYIPTLGSIFAAVPPVLLGWLQQGPGFAVLVALGYFIINFTLGSLLEPRFLGQGLGLSPLIVFLSLVVWAWILGPVGMLVAVPLTMTLKIALQSSDRTRWLATLLGPESPPVSAARAVTAWAPVDSKAAGGEKP